MNIAHHDATRTKDACQLFLSREHIIIIRLVVCNTKSLKHLPQRTLVVLRHHAPASLKAQSLMGLLVHLGHGSLLSRLALIDLINIDFHCYSLFISF